MPRGVLLPPSIELDIDFTVPVGLQIGAKLDALADSFAWFRLLDATQRQRLVDRLTDAASVRIAEFTGKLEALGEAFEADPSAFVEDLTSMHLEFSHDELQQACEQILPASELRERLLDRLDIQHIFGDAQEHERVARYAQLTVQNYERTDAVKRIDPDGSLFTVDLPSLLGKTWAECSELRFSALGCHGTAAASLKNLESKGQFLSIVWRGISGQQKAVGDEVVRWHMAQRARGRTTFGFILGDNFYESGIPRTNEATVDKLFQQAYVDVYNTKPGRDKRPLGCHYFAALGNHDYNFHGHAALPGDGSEFANNLDRALAQVDYGYRHTFSGWNMPYRYYCVISPVANFFVIDSSTFLFDRRQQQWLRTLYERLAPTKRFRFLMSHHGYVTFGKRGAGHHAEGDVAKLAKTKHTKDAAKSLSRGRTGASEEAVLGAAAMDLKDNVNRHIFTWFAKNDLHFHFNVVAHDHFMASALLTYDVPSGDVRRTYYVLTGAGGAHLGGGNLDTLVRLGPNMANVDMIEKKYGFSNFVVSKDTVEVGFRIVDGGRAEDLWEPGDGMTFALSDDAMWSPRGVSTAEKRLVNPVLRGVFCKRGEGGFFHSSEYRRRYYEMEWGKPVFHYAEKPGKSGRKGDHTIDLRQVDPASRSWLNGGQARVVRAAGVDGLHELTFRTRSPARTWVFAVPPEVYPDLTAWLDSAIR
jgi:hypothetical protein